jgi:hypothetical protein
MTGGFDETHHDPDCDVAGYAGVRRSSALTVSTSPHTAVASVCCPTQELTRWIICRSHQTAERQARECALELAQSSTEIARFLPIEDFQFVLASDLLLELLRAIKRLDLRTKHHDA